ncbi:hypothetical protein IE53DRAFT_380351 [Violaceomyces palustris]|uniref:Uncharacterized protein n=1 Tax=Violaceomyces palustris TaxID=1673888 RepID=A0ACD0NV70_9BASI|nr:hypothetical protein IE53DRAFT_380351 [Violaceomyces palustris]
MSFKLVVAKRSSSSSKGGSTPSSSKWPLQLELDPSTSLAQLKKLIHSKNSKLHPSRQRITKEDKSPLLDDAKSLSQLGLTSGETVYLKDLGPQVAWSTVFLTEYAGPIFIHPLIYYYAPSIWRTNFEHSRMQSLALHLVLAHYVKRELETLFVHRFSNGTMPLFNIFKNSTHYWVLSGLLLSVFVYSPYYSASAVAGTIQDNDTFLSLCTVAFTLAELGNAYCHLILKWLRPAGTRERKIPRGFAFELVSCPNYFFEFLAWSAFTVLTLNAASALFAAVSTAQMTVWAIKKHKNYKKEFGKDYPRGRKVMFPWVF